MWALVSVGGVLLQLWNWKLWTRNRCPLRVSPGRQPESRHLMDFEGKTTDKATVEKGWGAVELLKSNSTPARLWYGSLSITGNVLPVFTFNAFHFTRSRSIWREELFCLYVSNTVCKHLVHPTSPTVKENKPISPQAPHIYPPLCWLRGWRL